MPPSSTPRETSVSCAAAAPYPTTPVSSDTKDETCSCRSNIQTPAAGGTCHSSCLQSKASPATLSLPTLEELEAVKKQVEIVQKQLADLVTTQRECFTCPVCRDLAFQPQITQCGHIYCAICIASIRSLAIEGNDPMKCGVCHGVLFVKLVPCTPLQTLIESMANAEGLTIPDNVSCVWPDRPISSYIESPQQSLSFFQSLTHRIIDA
ncbi:hypothetical protein BT96DRAFT_1007596 [Gymnopus androsaceus JB14]|uniref:RING-type domain-containing protein n=1 Tax=Gymnopus androsaceus JB14 TaxID=1447944 RepID=A0A6A4GH69_9AGAR|nr:hypothetical protein BT96DRAFT_1007596 [Gymnopus androsaceus JB14]